MTASFGIMRLDGHSVAPADLERMSQRLKHRGNATVRNWVDAQVGLGTRSHRRLGKAAAFQTLTQNGATYTFTGDVRIDNRKELIAALEGSGECGETDDAVLVLRAFARWGQRCPERMIGDFAFAIWDSGRKQLFCARDPVGLRSLFYHHDPSSHFVFASEIQPLLTLAGVPHRLRAARIAHYLLYAYEGKAVTFYDKVMRLPPGHTMTVSANDHELRCYWSPSSVSPMEFRSDEDYAAAFRELFFESVRCRLPTEGPVAASFSGGLDSSSVVATARHLTNRSRHGPIQTFTITWSGSDAANEMPYIDSVRAGGGIDAHFEPGDQANPFFCFSDMPLFPDEPPDNPLSRSGWRLRAQIRNRGVRELLEGLGGDQTVSFAFTYLADMVRDGQWRGAIQEARALSRIYFGGRMSTPSVLRAYALLPLVPLSIRRAFRSALDLRSHCRSVFLVPINQRFASEVGVRDILRGYEQKRRAAQSGGRFHAYLFEEEFAASPLESYEAANAAFGYESRCPFLDQRLIEFCLGLPREQRINGGVNRVIVRRALRDLLPEANRSRGGKGNANPAFATALLAHGRREMHRVIVEDPEPLAPFVDIPAIRKIHERFLQHGATADAYSVWTAVTLARWLVHSGLSP